MKKSLQLKIFYGFVLMMLVIGYTKIGFAKEDGAPSGNTGSPGDDNQTCAHVDCHTGSASSRDGLIFTDVPELGYLSGVEYLITVKVSEPGIEKFGFQASPQTIEGSKLGKLTLIDPLLTKLTGGSKYVTHTLSGTAGTDSLSWTFHWTPESASGDVTFYVAVNASDNEEDATGDLIFTNSLTIQEDPSNVPLSIEDLNKITFDLISPTSNYLILNVATAVNDNLEVSIFDVHGNYIKSTTYQYSNGSMQIPLDGISAGIYFVNLRNAQGTITKQFIKI